MGETIIGQAIFTYLTLGTGGLTPIKKKSSNTMYNK